MKKGFSLSELMLAVLMIGILAYVTIPRMQTSVISKYKAQTVAAQITTDMRLARQMAITYAVSNANGYAVKMIGTAPFTSYNVINSHDNSVVTTYSIDSAVSCTGGTLFHFGPLGNLLGDSGTQLVISSAGKTLTLTLVSATGTVKVTEN